MAENLAKWPSGRGPIAKIRPSDGCGRNAVPLAVERCTISTDLDVIWGMSAKLDKAVKAVVDKVAADDGLSRQGKRE